MVPEHPSLPPANGPGATGVERDTPAVVDGHLVVEQPTDAPEIGLVGFGERLLAGGVEIITSAEVIDQDHLKRWRGVACGGPNGLGGFRVLLVELGVLLPE